jgi:ADP-heptose:LPS heptosyltransferase
MKAGGPGSGSDARPEPPVLLLALAGIGDLIVAAPAVRALERHFGAANTHLAVVPRALEILTPLGISARPVVLDHNRVRWPRPLWSAASRRALRDFVSATRSEGYASVINLHEIGSVRGLVSLAILLGRIGVKRTLGRGWRRTRWPYLEAVPEKTLRGLHNTERYLKVAGLAGAESDQVRPALEPGPRPHDLDLPDGPYICINPGGFTGWKRWPAERYAAVGRDLAGTHTIVVLGGPEETGISREISAAIGEQAISLAGELDLAGLLQVIAGAELMITNNSGPMHMAAALDVPTVAIFGNLPTATLHPAMPGGRYRVLSSRRSLPLPALRPLLTPVALRAIATEEVLAAARELLTLPPGGRQPAAGRGSDR